MIVQSTLSKFKDKMKKFKVILSPKPGTTGGTQLITIDAKDKSQAERLAEAQYGSRYKINVQE